MGFSRFSLRRWAVATIAFFLASTIAPPVALSRSRIGTPGRDDFQASRRFSALQEAPSIAEVQRAALAVRGDLRLLADDRIRTGSWAAHFLEDFEHALQSFAAAPLPEWYGFDELSPDVVLRLEIGKWIPSRAEIAGAAFRKFARAWLSGGSKPKGRGGTSRKKNVDERSAGLSFQEGVLATTGLGGSSEWGMPADDYGVYRPQALDHLDRQSQAAAFGLLLQHLVHARDAEACRSGGDRAAIVCLPSSEPGILGLIDHLLLDDRERVLVIGYLAWLYPKLITYLPAEPIDQPRFPKALISWGEAVREDWAFRKETRIFQAYWEDEDSSAYRDTAPLEDEFLRLIHFNRFIIPAGYLQDGVTGDIVEDLISKIPVEGEIEIDSIHRRREGVRVGPMGSAREGFSFISTAHAASKQGISNELKQAVLDAAGKINQAVGKFRTALHGSSAYQNNTNGGSEMMDIWLDTIEEVTGDLGKLAETLDEIEVGILPRGVDGQNVKGKITIAPHINEKSKAGVKNQEINSVGVVLHEIFHNHDGGNNEKAKTDVDISSRMLLRELTAYMLENMCKTFLANWNKTGEFLLGLYEDIVSLLERAISFARLLAVWMKRVMNPDYTGWGNWAEATATVREGLGNLGGGGGGGGPGGPAEEGEPPSVKLRELFKKKAKEEENNPDGDPDKDGKPGPYYSLTELDDTDILIMKWGTVPEPSPIKPRNTSTNKVATETGSMVIDFSEVTLEGAVPDAEQQVEPGRPEELKTAQERIWEEINGGGGGGGGMPRREDERHTSDDDRTGGRRDDPLQNSPYDAGYDTWDTHDHGGSGGSSTLFGDEESGGPSSSEGQSYDSTSDASDVWTEGFFENPYRDATVETDEDGFTTEEQPCSGAGCGGSGMGDPVGDADGDDGGVGPWGPGRPDALVDPESDGGGTGGRRGGGGVTGPGGLDPSGDVKLEDGPDGGTSGDSSGGAFGGPRFDPAGDVKYVDPSATDEDAEADDAGAPFGVTPEDWVKIEQEMEGAVEQERAQ